VNFFLEENKFTFGFVHASGFLSSCRYSFKMWLQSCNSGMQNQTTFFLGTDWRGKHDCQYCMEKERVSSQGMVTNVPPRPVSGSRDPTSLLTSCTGARTAQFPPLSFCFITAQWRLWLCLK